MKEGLNACCRALADPETCEHRERYLQAVAYVEITTHSRVTLFGVGVHNNIITASLLAVISAVNRATARGAMNVAA